MPFDPKAFLGQTPTTVETTEAPPLIERERPRRGEFDPQAFLGSGRATVETAQPEPQTTTTPPVSAAVSAVPSTGPVIPESAELLPVEPGGAAPAFVTTGPTGINPQAVTQSLKPLAGAIPKTLGLYMNRPVSGIADMAAVAMGFPPPVASYQGARGLMELPGAVSSAASEIGKATSTGQAIAGSPRTTTMDPYFELRDAVRKAGAGDIYDDVMKANYARGGNNAVLSGLETNEKFRKLLAENTDVARAWNSYKGVVPTVPQQVGRVAMPLLRGAAKVAGPAGLAYDVYEAYPYYQASGAPERLASGEVKQTMNQAMRAPLNAPTPAPLSGQEARNLYESGDQRLIEIYKNDAELSALIRKRAAEKVLGPVAP